jgi:hypothetical protein
MEKILAVQEILRKLPVKEKEKSSGEVVEFLKADLRKAVKQGHSLKDIQATLAEQGISVPLSRMETVLGKPGKESARKKTDARQSSPKVGKTEPGSGVDVPKSEPVKQETISARQPERKLPSYFTPDLPDSKYE